MSKTFMQFTNLNTKVKRHCLPHISCFMWFTNPNPASGHSTSQVMSHLLTCHSTPSKMQMTLPESANSVISFLSLLGPNSSPWALAIVGPVLVAQSRRNPNAVDEVSFLQDFKSSTEGPALVLRASCLQ